MQFHLGLRSHVAASGTPETLAAQIAQEVGCDASEVTVYTMRAIQDFRSETGRSDQATRRSYCVTSLGPNKLTTARFLSMMTRHRSLFQAVCAETDHQVREDLEAALRIAEQLRLRCDTLLMTNARACGIVRGVQDAIVDAKAASTVTRVESQRVGAILKAVMPYTTESRRSREAKIAEANAKFGAEYSSLCAKLSAARRPDRAPVYESAESFAVPEL